jgi:D-alanyl-D-alanine carboxypeptidase/D-alanyl-D-alanine-endopeptidase (penicillin-binding protein 4)
MRSSPGGKMRAGVRRPDLAREFRTRSARIRSARRRAALVGLLSAIILAVLWFSHSSAPRAVVTAQPSATPKPPAYSSTFIRSGARWSAPQAHDLARTAAQIFGDGVFPASTGVVVEDALSGKTLYARNASTAFAPASVLKVVVAATVLRALGPGYRFTTRLVTDVAPQGDTLPGSLWLVGGGDPELTSADLKRAVAAMKAGGILRVSGDVIADGSLFGPDAVNPTWAADDLEYGYAALTSAVTMDGGTAQFTVTPDPNGGIANVHVDPDAIAGELVGDVRTGSAYAENTLRIDPLPDGSGFRLSGTIPFGAPQKYWRSLAHPTLAAAVALRAMLIDAGIGVGGGIAVGQAPVSTVTVWTRRSRPLAAIVRRMMFDSDNHIAEQLLRAAGAQRVGTGSLENGLEAEREYMQGIGVGQSASVLADASGLSTADRLSAQAATTVLRDLVSSPDAATYTALLPRVGVDGTVHVRHLAPDIRGRVLGKDGYIEGVSGLAGYVKTEHHGLVIYAFLVNGWERGLDAVWANEDDFLSRLARM